MRLAGKNCVVTGGATGIGEAIARRFSPVREVVLALHRTIDLTLGKAQTIHRY